MKHSNKTLFTEKRKWQIALRRYVVEQRPVPDYAPYFGIDIIGFRDWLSLGAAEGLNWSDFGKSWQLEQVVPFDYFDPASADDLAICWHFTNIRAKLVDKEVPAADLLTAKSYFIILAPCLPQCAAMISHIEKLENSLTPLLDGQVAFLQRNREKLEQLRHFESFDFSRLNTGASLEEIVVEKRMLEKFGQ